MLGMSFHYNEKWGFGNRSERNNATHIRMRQCGVASFSNPNSRWIYQKWILKIEGASQYWIYSLRFPSFKLIIIWTRLSLLYERKSTKGKFLRLIACTFGVSTKMRVNIDFDTCNKFRLTHFDKEFSCLEHKARTNSCCWINFFLRNS